MSPFTKTPAEPGYFAVRLLKAGGGQPVGIRLDPITAWLDTIGGRTAVTPFDELFRPTTQQPDGSVRRPDGSIAPSVENWFLAYRQIWQDALRAEVTI